MWVCGLKHQYQQQKNPKQTSHPMWVCGLKLLFPENLMYHQVAPYVGVWIETPFRPPAPAPARSHPMWVCGLKQREAKLRW